MILEKQDAEVWVKCEDELPTEFNYYKIIYDDGESDEKPFRIRPSKNIHGFMTERVVAYWLKHLKSVYVLTETQLETLKQEYYAIGLKQAEDSFNSHLR